MKSYRAQSGPFNERPYYSDDEIEEICVDELRAVQLLPSKPEPIRIDWFIEKRFKVVPSYDDLGKGILGLTKFGKDGVKEVIVARALDEEQTSVAERRIRSTLAHESGHGLLHAHLFALAPQKPLFGDFSEPGTPKVLCREEDGLSARAYSGKWWEYQANRAIGALLIPRQLAEIVLKKFMSPEGSLGLKSFNYDRYDEAFEGLVNVFDVNPAVAKIRINQLYRKEARMQMSL